MDQLYAYSLMPVVAVSWLIALTVLFRMRSHIGLGVFAGALAFWSSNLLITYFPPLADIASRLAGSGAFVTAGFLHAAYAVIGRSHRGLLILAYSTAALVTLAGVFIPGLLFDPVTLSAGPGFWPGMALAVAGATVPLVFLFREALRRPDRSALYGLAASGIAVYVGAWSNAYLLSTGRAEPWGMLLVLAGTLLLARVIWKVQPSDEQRVLDRSLLYSAIATFVSGGFLLGIGLVVEEGAGPLIGEYGVGAVFLIAMAFIALDPLRQLLQERLGRTVASDAAAGSDLAKKLGEKEREAAQARRMAEIGTLTSAVAHEVRNPLGVLKAHLKILERSEAPEATVEAMRQQIERASGFVDDLLSYGRPSPLRIRRIELFSTIRLAWSTALQALDREGRLVLDDGRLEIDADAGQLQQVFIILFENALLAAGESVGETGAGLTVSATQDGDDIVCVVEDDGPGIPAEIAEKLFEPFVTGRKRGTGLGLAIARAIVERHGGTIRLTGGAQGARFEIRIPRFNKALSAAKDGDDAP